MIITTSCQTIVLLWNKKRERKANNQIGEEIIRREAVEEINRSKQRGKEKRKQRREEIEERKKQRDRKRGEREKSPWNGESISFL